MPRKKKNGQSPARVPPPPGLLSNEGSRSQEPLFGATMASSNFTPSSSSTAQSQCDKETIVRNMQEMFSHLEPEVIYIVLSECDFKVENAMDSLLELSVAAEVATPFISGFEQTAAALLNPSPVECDPVLDSSEPSQLPFSASPLPDDLDLLIDQELQTLTTQPELNEDLYLSAADPISSFTPPTVLKQALPELLQSSLDPNPTQAPRKQSCLAGVTSEQTGQALPQLDQLSILGKEDTMGKPSVLDFSYLTSGTQAAKQHSNLDLGSSGRPSAFQAYRKQDQPPAPSHTPTGGIVGGARSKVSTSTDTDSNQQLSWNPDATEFFPYTDGKQGPVFITPVVQKPSPWESHPRSGFPWLGQRPVSQAPLKPSATIPKSWATPAAPQGPGPNIALSRLRLEGRVLVMLRGAPGSGKSTLARAMLEQNPGGVVLSTDDYFSRNGTYQFDPSVLGDAHEWNHKRAKESFMNGANPIIIDNTNMQSWEMRPYVAQAIKHKYKVLFRDPDTWWKNKPRELQRRSKHGVPVERIRRMLENCDRFVSVQSIMGSQPPERIQAVHQGNMPSQPGSADATHPDIVGEPGLSRRSEKPRFQAQHFSSLPDVSSSGCEGVMGLPGNTDRSSTDYLNPLSSERVQENPEVPDEDEVMDFRELDSELDAQLQMVHPMGDQGIPDCIVESVLTEDNHSDERPVAFSDSIAQRVKRERRSRKSDFEMSQPADLVKDTNQSEREAGGVEEKGQMKATAAVGGELSGDGSEKGRPELLDFVGDWPSPGLEQRQGRRKEINGEEEGQLSRKVDGHANRMKARPGPDVTEFQRLLDLIQTGVTSPDSVLIPGSGEGSDRESEEGDESQECDRDDRERREQLKKTKVRTELPDCVLDWKVCDSFLLKEPSRAVRVESGAGVSENGQRNVNERRDDILEVDREKYYVGLESENPSDSLSYLSMKKDGYDGAEADLCHTDKVKKDFSSSLIGIPVDAHGEGSRNPFFEIESNAEADSGPLTGGSQERRQRQSRRSGKQCKLALTFTQNSPSPKSLKDSPHTTTPNSSHRSTESDVELNSNPDCNLTLDPKLDFDLSHDPIPNPNHLSREEYLSIAPDIDSGCPTQTDPQDFALLWRLNQHNIPDDTVVADGKFPNDITVLSGNPSRFLSCAAVVVDPSGPSVIPDRVVHEKGTQVEEKEISVVRSRLDNLRILSRHFKLVCFDTLEDLYDKCHQDLEWTTNLLLDSQERFFRDEEGKEDVSVLAEEDGNPLALCVASGVDIDSGACSGALDKLHPEEEVKAQPAGGVEDGNRSNNVGSPSRTIKESCGGSDGEPGSAGVMREDGSAIAGAISQLAIVNNDRCDERLKSSQPLLSLLGDVEDREGSEDTQEGNTETSSSCKDIDSNGGDVDEGEAHGELRDENGGDEMSHMDEVTRSLVVQLEEIKRREGQQRKEQRKEQKEKHRRHLDIQSVELKLPTELAIQLAELFGPVGIDPGACSAEDYAVRMDLNLAKLLHQKWKDCIQERQRQAALSYHLLQESSSHWGESQLNRAAQREGPQPAHFLLGADGYASLGSQPEARDDMPFMMDHWSLPQHHVSLRDIMSEEQALQETLEKSRQSVDQDRCRRDGATILKEQQLLSLFPNIDRIFLQDIFRDHNYCLIQTEQFLRSLLDEGPVKTVVAPEAPKSDTHRTPSKEREKRQKPPEPVLRPHYQDVEDPEYEDFRAEASLQRDKQNESFCKAAEAYSQNRKDVASFYAQQGHLHGERMREANRRAAAQIFDRVNASLLPSNILDLHGLHVDEAIQHMAQVLQDKTAEYQQGQCQLRLSIITGRGNHSLGGVARIRPAVIDYLNSHNYRFTEPKLGLVLVSLNRTE